MLRCGGGWDMCRSGRERQEQDGDIDSRRQQLNDVIGALCLNGSLGSFVSYVSPCLTFIIFFVLCVCVFLCVYTFLHSHSFSLNPQFVLVFICLPHSCATAYSWPSLFFFFSFCLSLYLSLCLSLSCFSAFPSASPWPAFCVPDRSFRQVFLSRIQCDYWSRFSFWTVAVAVAVARNFSASCCAVVSFALLWGRWQSCLSLSPSPSLASHVTVAIPICCCCCLGLAKI